MACLHPAIGFGNDAFWPESVSALSGITNQGWLHGLKIITVAVVAQAVWGGILTAADFGLAISAFTLLQFWKAPPWLVVILGAAGGEALFALR